MNASIVKLVQSIHASPTMASVVVTGGGVQAISWLLGVPGASKTIIDATVPYSEKALQAYVNSYPHTTSTPNADSKDATASEQQVGSSVSEDTALMMAHAALRRARSLCPDGADAKNLVGLGCTAALATDRARRGNNHCYVACVSSNEAQRVYYCRLERGKRERIEEDTLVSKLIVNALLRRANLSLSEASASDTDLGDEEQSNLHKELGLNLSDEEFLNITSPSVS